MPMPKTPQAVFDAKIAKVSEIDWARLAAFIDGEGTIMIGRTQKANGAIYHMLAVIVSGTSPLLMTWLQDTFSGETYLVPASKWRANATCYSWRMHEARAEAILLHCLPHFIIKGEQARVALAYRALRRQGSKGTKLTPDVIQARDSYAAQMRLLNKSRIEVEKVQ